MRKGLIVLFVLFFLVTSFSFAQMREGGAIGGQFNGGYGNYAGFGGAALSFKFPKLPIMWGANLGFGLGTIHFGVTGDWWFLNKEFDDTPLGVYVGAGIFGGMYTSVVGGLDAAVGARVPVGLQFWLFELVEDMPNKLEFFVELAPGLGVSFGASGFNFPAFNLGAAIGARWWF